MPAIRDSLPVNVALSGLGWDNVWVRLRFLGRKGFATQIIILTQQMGRLWSEMGAPRRRAAAKSSAFISVNLRGAAICD